MAKKQQITERTTLVKFAIQQSTYIEGEGSRTEWIPVCVPIGEIDGKTITTDCFYCEWLNSYGANAIMQQQMNNLQTARVRMPFVQKLYDALVTTNVRIYKNGRMDALNTFVLNSSPDNYLEQNGFIEFQVKRYEDK